MKSRAKNLGLTGLILGASIFSGCKGLNDNSILGMGLSAVGVHKNNPLAQVVGNQLANYGAHQAGASNVNVYVSDSEQRAKPVLFDIFTCTLYQDFNNDKIFDLTNEVVDRGKTDFFVGEDYTYAAALLNCKGKELKFFGSDKIGEPVREMHRMMIDRDNWFGFIKGKLTKESVGHWYAYWTLDGVKVGDHRISVKPDPSDYQSK